MLLPIGHDQGELRRWPVLSFTILGLCVLLQFMPSGVSQEKMREADAAFEESLSYYVEHPEITPHPLLRGVALRYAARLGGDEGQALRAKIEHPPPASPLSELRQQSLDRKTQIWLDVVRKQTSWQWGYTPGQSDTVRLFTHMFLHADFMHLFFNMLFLYILAPFIEDQWGRPLFLGFYLTTGVVAALMYAWHSPDASAPLVGASGAIAGVMGAFLVRFPRASIKFLRLFPPGTFQTPAWVFLPLWFAGQLISARMQSLSMPTSGAMVAYWAHVYGFGFGLLVGLVMWMFKVEDRYVQPAIAAQSLGGTSVMPMAERLLGAGKRLEACNLLEREVAQSPSNLNAVFAYWTLAAELGRMPDRTALCQRVLTFLLSFGEEMNALDLWPVYQAAVPDAPIETRLAVLLSRALQENRRRGEAATVIEQIDATARLDAEPELLVELGGRAIALGPSNAEALVKALLRHPRVPRADKQRLSRAAGLDEPVPAEQAIMPSRA